MKMTSCDEEFGLIHIGLPKTATTYLQAVWFLSRSHDLVDVSPFVDACCEFARSGRSWREAKVDALIPSNVKSDRYHVISHEGLSQAFLDETRYHQRLKAYQKNVSKIILSRVSSASVLLVIRDPVQWIRSIYEQYIKQGGVNTYEEFLESHQKYLMSVLDVDELLEFWSRDSGDVVVMPMEMLGSDENAFWNALYGRAGMPVPDAKCRKEAGRNPQFRNMSISNNVEFLRVMNIIMDEVYREYDELKGMPHNLNKERIMLKKYFSHSANWIVRRIAEYKKDVNIKKLYEYVNIKSVDHSHYNIPEHISDFLVEKFISPLRLSSFIDRLTIESYEKSLSASRKR